MKDELDSLKAHLKLNMELRQRLPKAVGITSDPVHAHVQIEASREVHNNIANWFKIQLTW